MQIALPASKSIVSMNPVPDEHQYISDAVRALCARAAAGDVQGESVAARMGAGA